MTAASAAFPVVDQAERAVRDLIRHGLVHGHGDFVLSSRAAVQAETIRA